ncbi:hypothetical protein CVT24_009089 [Panaeolus cyanescens]|uniref:DUF788-domain-containing protein n=1 Tax=Panaeolus cyanescens TaxID=181874 RepID=A0A409VAP2_9AGAR|nr:hypothetical protein CVT24_009089 [Panaeolus cyanescens]
MANASAKRIASQNETLVKVLKLGMLLPTVISILLRFLFRRGSWPPSVMLLVFYVVASAPAALLSLYLINIGSPKREPTTNTLIFYGEDLSQPGVTEWCFDIIYITYACQIGSGAFGDWFWWFYMIIPLYAVFKIWTSFISPMVLGRGASEPEENAKEPATSKRQEKLRKRQEKGDPRVRVSSVRK